MLSNVTLQSVTDSLKHLQVPAIPQYHVNLPTIGLAAGAIAVGYVVTRYFWELIPVGGHNKKAVFITGCDTGFGRALSLKCARAGFTVFAGCLTEDGGQSLKKEAGDLSLHVVKLDVTKDDSVAAARKYVGDNLAGTELWAIVNNAGIFTCYGATEWSTPDEYKLSMDVNLIGGVRVTNAFLDLLKLSRGRVISVSSVAGRISTPGAAPYSAAKYGVEAWNDALRREMKAFGIDVCLLEPGAFQSTALLDKDAHRRRVDSVWNKLTPKLREEYGEEYKNALVDQWNNTLDRIGSRNINHVVNNYYHAITAYFPRKRYQCGWDAILFWMPLSFTPTPLQDFLLSTLIASGSPTSAIMKKGGFKKHN